MKPYYNYDICSNTLTVNDAFLKAASCLDTPEYKQMLQLRKDNGNFTIVIKDGPKKAAAPDSKLTYTDMKQFIKQCRNAKERLAVYEKVYALSRAQCSPYHYVKKWFLDNYANYSEKPEFDEDGFVIVKTKAQMEAEKAAAASAAAAPEKTDSGTSGIAAEAPRNDATDNTDAAA